MLVGAAVCGFALSQWLADHRRAAQELVTAELRDRIEQMSRTESRLTGAYCEIETRVLRDIGLQGVVVTASIPACKPAQLGGTELAASTAEAADAPLRHFHPPRERLHRGGCEPRDFVRDDSRRRQRG